MNFVGDTEVGDPKGVEKVGFVIGNQGQLLAISKQLHSTIYMLKVCAAENQFKAHPNFLVMAISAGVFFSTSAKAASAA
jgi:hypothetical protein